MSSLEGVKVGDFLFFRMNLSDPGRVKLVNLITNTYAYTEDGKWRISDGRMYGDGRSDFPRFARIATPDDIRAENARRARDYARSKFGHMTDDQAIRVADFIREMLKDGAE